MKHNTHIYFARKGIDFLYDACQNLVELNNNKVKGKRKSRIRREAKELQRLLIFHENDILEASWAPDDVLCDKSLYHTFKLFTSDLFTDSKEYALETHNGNGKEYFRAKQGGGLPFKVDHLAKIIRDMIKLRNYNDVFSMRAIMYMMILLSHYVVDAHVPMHCDLRDDSPKEWTPKNGVYYDDKYHGILEKYWDDATTSYAVKSGCMIAERNDDYKMVLGRVDLSSEVSFDLRNKDHIKEVKVYDIPPNQLMRFIIGVCMRANERNQLIFGKGKTEPDLGKFKDLTRPIYTDCIGNLISVWLYIWS